MDDLLGIDLIDCAGDNLAAIAPMVIFPASADKRVVTRYGEVTSASFARPGAATYIAASGEVKQVGADVPRVGSTGWILEGSATSYYAQTYTANADGTISTDAPITRTVSLPNTGSYVLWCKGGAGLSVAVAAGTAVGSGWGSLTASGYLPLNITTAGTVTVTVTGGATGDQVQLTTGSVPTSYIPTPTTTPVTRASEGADTSGNGLSLELSPAMVDSLKGEMIDWSTVWSFNGDAATYITVTAASKQIAFSGAQTSSKSCYKSGAVSAGSSYEVNYTVSGVTAGYCQIGSDQAGGTFCPNVSADGSYTHRFTAGTTTIMVRGTAGFNGTLAINYVRRVLESGSVNRGEGTLIQWIELPWGYDSIPANSKIGVLGLQISAYST